LIPETDIPGDVGITGGLGFGSVMKIGVEVQVLE